MDTVVSVILNLLFVTSQSSGEKIFLVIIIYGLNGYKDRHTIRDYTPQNRQIIRYVLV